MKSVLASLAFSLGQGLHVTQWQDSLVILPGHFIELTNSNVQNFLSAAVDSKTQLQQDINIDLVSHINLAPQISECFQSKKYWACSRSGRFQNHYSLGPLTHNT